MYPESWECEWCSVNFTAESVEHHLYGNHLRPTLGPVAVYKCGTCEKYGEGFEDIAVHCLREGHDPTSVVMGHDFEEYLYQLFKCLKQAMEGMDDPVGRKRGVGLQQQIGLQQKPTGKQPTFSSRTTTSLSLTKPAAASDDYQQAGEKTEDNNRGKKRFEGILLGEEHGHEQTVATNENDEGEKIECQKQVVEEGSSRIPGRDNINFRKSKRSASAENRFVFGIQVDNSNIRKSTEQEQDAQSSSVNADLIPFKSIIMTNDGGLRKRIRRIKVEDDLLNDFFISNLTVGPKIETKGIGDDYAEEAITGQRKSTEKPSVLNHSNNAGENSRNIESSSKIFGRGQKSIPSCNSMPKSVVDKQDPTTLTTTTSITAEKRSLLETTMTHGETDGWGLRKVYSCGFCAEKFGTLYAARVHEKTHGEQRPYPCINCEKAFHRMDNLKVHERVHTGEKPYKCHECGAPFAVSSHLTTHMRTHTGDKPYPCPICGRSFTTSSTLKYHIKCVHEGMPPRKKNKSSTILLGYNFFGFQIQFS